METENFLILGIGNKYRCDDGAGIETAEVIKGFNIDKFIVKTLDGEGIGILKELEENENVIIIDAVRNNGKAGNVYELNANDVVIKSGFFNYSSHAFGLAEAINVAKVMNKLPKFLIVYGIEGGKFNFDTKLTKKVKQAVKITAETIKERYGN